MKKGFLLLVGMLFFSIIAFSGCTDAMVASSNISQDADQFEVFRRVVFYNGITDSYILVVEGYCSVLHDEDGDINIIVKTGPKEYLKHMLGPSDNVTWFAEQIEPDKVSTARYRVVFKPSVLLPDFDLE